MAGAVESRRCDQYRWRRYVLDFYAGWQEIHRQLGPARHLRYGYPLGQQGRCTLAQELRTHRSTTQSAQIVLPAVKQIEPLPALTPVDWMALINTAVPFSGSTG